MAGDVAKSPTPTGSRARGNAAENACDLLDKMNEYMRFLGCERSGEFEKLARSAKLRLKKDVPNPREQEIGEMAIRRICEMDPDDPDCSGIIGDLGEKMVELGIMDEDGKKKRTDSLGEFTKLAVRGSALSDWSKTRERKVKNVRGKNLQKRRKDGAGRGHRG